MDFYAQDDWRMKPYLTLNYGLRYEFFAPYTEKYGHLAFVDTIPIATSDLGGLRRPRGDPGRRRRPLQRPAAFFAGLSFPPRNRSARRLCPSPAPPDRLARRLRLELRQQRIRHLRYPPWPANRW